MFRPGSQPATNAELLWHCTGIDEALSILRSRQISNSRGCSPAAVYCTADWSNAFYDRGCTIGVKPVGCLLGKAATKPFLAEDPGSHEHIFDQASLQLKLVKLEVFPVALHKSQGFNSPNHQFFGIQTTMKIVGVHTKAILA